MTISPGETMGKVSSLLSAYHGVFAVCASDGSFNSYEVWGFMLINLKVKSVLITKLNWCLCVKVVGKEYDYIQFSRRDYQLHCGFACLQQCFCESCVLQSCKSLRTVLQIGKQNDWGTPLLGNHIGRLFYIVMSSPQYLFHYIHKNPCP